jgi:uncharacterized protein (TIGR02646 family)
MLNLNKIEPDCFIDFKKKNSPKNYEKDCDHTVRECLRESLFNEQKGQCFYCEQKIKESRIDHFIPRDISNEKDIECNYNNLFLSCDRKESCDIRKANKFDENRYIRLFSNRYNLENPSDFFDYTARGTIKAKKILSDDKKIRAKNTIELLNLNNNDLVNARKTVYSTIGMYKNSGHDIDEIFTFFNEFESLFKGD